jgi:hypothetical protein
MHDIDSSFGVRPDHVNVLWTENAVIDSRVDGTLLGTDDRLPCTAKVAHKQHIGVAYVTHANGDAAFDAPLEQGMDSAFQLADCLRMGREHIATRWP